MGTTPGESYVYVLHDPSEVSQRIYVGWSGNPQRRNKDRMREVRRGLGRLVHHWIRKLGLRGVTPDLVLLEAVPPGGDWVEAESFWIAYFRSIGAEMANLTTGGEGRPGYKMPAEVRAKIGRANLGNKAFQGKTHSEDVKRGMRERMLGRVASGETRLKLSAINLGKTISPETRAKIGAASRGRKHSEGARLKMSAAASGKKMAPERVRQMSERMTGQRAAVVRGHSRTGFKGVSRCGDRFVARIKIDGKTVSLRTFQTPEEAARAYDAAARRAWGANAALNFPGPDERSARKP